MAVAPAARQSVPVSVARSDELLSRARRRDDVVTVAEALALAVSPRSLQRQVDSGRWQRLHRGVYVIHNGPPTWRTTARAALAFAGRGAALSHDAAAYVHEFGGPPPRVVDVTIPGARYVMPSGGVRIHRAAGRAVEMRARFPVVGKADTAADLSGAARGGDRVLEVVAAAVRAGAWPEHIAQAVERRPNARNRGLVLEMVLLAADGVESALELRYHRDVERRHGLPVARRQAWEKIGGWWIRADCVYEGLGVRCELDGAFAHPGGRTDRDTWRDNAVMIDRGDITLRYRWIHVAVAPCKTAAQVAAALRTRGWLGEARACGPACAVAR